MDQFRGAWRGSDVWFRERNKLEKPDRLPLNHPPLHNDGPDRPEKVEYPGFLILILNGAHNGGATASVQDQGTEGNYDVGTSSASAPSVDFHG